MKFVILSLKIFIDESNPVKNNGLYPKDFLFERGHFDIVALFEK